MHIDSNYEVVACTVFFKNFKINICNVYFPNHVNITLNEINNLFNSIPDPKIVLGDVNAKHISWGSPTNCSRGITLANSLLTNDLLVLNNGEPTRYDKFTNMFSHIDVTSCSTALGTKLDWSIMDDTNGSDHFPILIFFDFEQQYSKRSIRYKLDKADWINYRLNVKLPNTFTSATLDLTRILTSFIEVASEYIPTSNPNVNTKYNVLWWRDSCKVALSNAKKQFRILKRNHTRENITLFNMLEALAIREI